MIENCRLTMLITSLESMAIKPFRKERHPFTPKRQPHRLNPQPGQIRSGYSRVQGARALTEISASKASIRERSSSTSSGCI